MTSRGCEATLEKLDGDKYVEVWRKPLVNAVAPVSALISEKDATFVTFDNWERIGRGDDVMVVYDGSGNVKREFSLNEIVPEAQQSKLRHSVSSIHWGDRHLLDHQDNILHLFIEEYEPQAPRWWSSTPPEPKKTFRTLFVDLATARFVPSK